MRTDRAHTAPDSAALADAAADLVGAYVHIPFCRSICPYCDFAVVEGTGAADRYVDALIAEIERSEPLHRPLDAVAIGGGTPTSMPASELGRVIDALRRRFGFADDVEVSVEANPEDLDRSAAQALADIGVGRISLGVQSFDDVVLRNLGRRHTASEAAAAVEVALESVPRASLDLIFGTPGETPESWERSVRTALATGVGHLSTYALTVERGTPLSREVRAGAPAPDPDAQAEAYAVACDLAAASGLVRYETSNHARAGETVAYNLLIWAQGEYVAFGNGAHRHLHGVRSWNVRRVDRYIERIEAGESPISGQEHLQGWGRDAERVVLGVRRAAGVVPGPVGKALLASDEGSALVDAGVLAARDGRLVVTDPMLENEVARAVLGLEPVSP